jgi:hypothetical protein
LNLGAINFRAKLLALLWILHQFSPFIKTYILIMVKYASWIFLVLIGIYL